jgi:hypothetical protein
LYVVLYVALLSPNALFSTPKEAINLETSAIKTRIRERLSQTEAERALTQ